jgi:hypothetical protein
MDESRGRASAFFSSCVVVPSDAIAREDVDCADVECPVRFLAVSH